MAFVRGVGTVNKEKMREIEWFGHVEILVRQENGVSRSEFVEGLLMDWAIAFKIHTVRW